MDLNPLTTVALTAIILIGGPIWLIRNAVTRRRERADARSIDHYARVQNALDILGPLSPGEMTELLRLTLLSISSNGGVDWDEMQANTALARRTVRERHADVGIHEDAVSIE